MTVGTVPVEETRPEVRRPVSIRRETPVDSEYELLEEIGRGKFGRVVRCRHLSTHKYYAAKLLRCPQREDRANFEREVDVMNALHHENVLRIVDAFEHRRIDMCLVTELVEGGELFELVVDESFELTERLAKHFMAQILNGVAYMHSQHVVHLDLKPENIMCVRPGMAEGLKLIDFGLARRLDEKNSEQVLFGTPEFVAPEVVAFEPIHFATDMWAVGVILYVLLSGLSPFMGDTDLETMANVTLAEYDFEDDAFAQISSEGKDLIDQLLVKSMRKRFTAQQCLEHKWFKTNEFEVENNETKSREKPKKSGQGIMRHHDYYAFHLPSHTMTHIKGNKSENEGKPRLRRSRSVISLDDVMAKADEMRLVRNTSASHDDLIHAAKKPKLNNIDNISHYNIDNNNDDGSKSLSKDQLESVELVQRVQQLESNNALIPTTVEEISEQKRSCSESQKDPLRQPQDLEETEMKSLSPSLSAELAKSEVIKETSTPTMLSSNTSSPRPTSLSLLRSTALLSPLCSPNLVKSPISLERTFAELLAEVENQLQEVREAKRRSREARARFRRNEPVMNIDNVINSLSMESNPWLLADIVDKEEKTRRMEEQEMDEVMRHMRETIEMCSLAALTSFGLHQPPPPPPPRRSRPRRTEDPRWVSSKVITFDEPDNGSGNLSEANKERVRSKAPKPPPRSRSRDAICPRCKALIRSNNATLNNNTINNSRSSSSSSRGQQKCNIANDDYKQKRLMRPGRFQQTPIK